MAGLNIKDVKVGDHVTIVLYTDRHSYTVLRKTKSMVEIQKDKQEIDFEKWKPEFIAGGFAGHCENNRSQKWKVESDPNGVIKKIYAGRDGILKTKGSKRPDVIKGAKPFHDYNF